MTLRPALSALFALLALSQSPAILAQSGSAARDLEMRGEPKNEAPIVHRVPRGARFDLLARQGAWARINTDGRQGWVLFFFLQFGEAPKADAGREVAGVARLATGRPAGDITATIGARGLSEEQLRSAGYSEREMKRLESLAASADSASQFAAQGSLAAKRVPMLVAPSGVGGDSPPSPPSAPGG